MNANDDDTPVKTVEWGLFRKEASDQDFEGKNPFVPELSTQELDEILVPELLDVCEKSTLKHYHDAQKGVFKSLQRVGVEWIFTEIRSAAKSGLDGIGLSKRVFDLLMAIDFFATATAIGAAEDGGARLWKYLEDVLQTNDLARTIEKLATTQKQMRGKKPTKERLHIYEELDKRRQSKLKKGSLFAVENELVALYSRLKKPLSARERKRIVSAYYKRIERSIRKQIVTHSP